MRVAVISISCCLVALAACSSDENEPPNDNTTPPAADVDSSADEDGATSNDDTPGSSSSGGEDVSVDELAPGSGEGDDDAAPAVPSIGCGPAASLTSGEHTVTVDDLERTFLVDLPTDYDAAVPYPLVFAFHGATTSAAFFRNARYGNLLSAMASDAIVVHADALGDPTAWNNARDLPFFDAMLAELEASACVDTERVFATGHSSGGFFTNMLGCQRGDVLRAIAPVAGGGPFGGAGCTGEVAVWLAHGDNDETVPFTSGEQSRDRWLDRNGCDAGSSTAATPSECIDYAGCADGLPVRWCVHQDGHDWPDFAPQGMWEFFESL